ncbi:MAG: hypothetical protein QM486_08550 [Flavobacteriaceae bacterium]
MELQGWDKIYEEIALKLTNGIPVINWADLWHNQVGFLIDEHPFPTPAIFLSFRIINTEDMGEKVQGADLQVDVYYFYETFLDTFQGAYNKTDALNYLKTNTDIHKLLHGSSGTNYAEMRRVGFGPVDTGTSGNLYKQSFVCNIIDATAAKVYNQAKPGDVNYSKGSAPAKTPGNLYNIPAS